MEQGIGDVRGILGNELDVLCDIVADLSDAELILASGCVGWRVADVLVHVRMGAEALFAGLASPASDEPDRDFVSYWRDWPAQQAPGYSDVRATWAMAAVYSSGDGLRAHFGDVVRAAARAARDAGSGIVRFQEHVLETDDLLAIWVVEFALHHLDLVVEMSERPLPTAGALALVLNQALRARLRG